MKPRKPLKPKDYVKQGGTICPNCLQTGDVQIVGRIDIENGFQPCKCWNCGSTWNDIYLLTGYEDLVIGGDL